jgi:hypothetical protein
VKFALSDPTAEIPEPVFREVDIVKSAHLILMLVAEQDTTLYRQIASQLRYETSAKDSKSLSYACIHPEWFDGDEELQVDSTTCSFCGYGHSCTMGEENTAHVEIVPLLGATIPSRAVMAKLFNFEHGEMVKLPYDPFLGFSPKAGDTRKIYLAKHSQFLRHLPDNSHMKIFHHHAIGYDRHTGQSLWTMDYQLLSTLEKLKKSKVLSFDDFLIPESPNITLLDRELIIDCSQRNNWLTDDDGTEEQTILLRFFSGLKDYLSSSRMFTSLSSYGNNSSTPLIDHPHIRSTSNWMNMALRWMELKPNDFVRLLEPLGDVFLLGRVQVSNVHLEAEKTTYLPRFPVLALIPKGQKSQIRLEEAAFRVVDVTEYSGKDVLLLIDGLGINLREEL